jgi:hypothetical protein
MIVFEDWFFTKTRPISGPFLVADTVTLTTLTGAESYSGPTAGRAENVQSPPGSWTALFPPLKAFALPSQIANKKIGKARRRN